MRVILDACAVIAFFKGEVGADVVEEYLFNSIYDCVIHLGCCKDAHTIERGYSQCS